MIYCQSLALEFVLFIVGIRQNIAINKHLFERNILFILQLARLCERFGFYFKLFSTLFDHYLGIMVDFEVT